MPPEDEVLPTEEQPLPAAASPNADSPGYVPEFDPEEDLEEDDEEDPEEDPADYPANGGYDGDDEDESSDDDEDDDVDIVEDEEEEHPSPADSTTVALPAVDHAPSAEETEQFEIDESAATPPSHPAYHVTARMSIRDEPPTPFWSEAEIARLLAIPSPLSPWSSPLPQIPSPPLLVSLPLPVSPLPLPTSPTSYLGYRAAMIRLRAEAPSTSHLLPLPSPIVLPCTRASVAMLRAVAPSTYILAPRSEAPPADIREACLPPRKRLCFAFGPRYEVGERLSAFTTRPDGDVRRDYGFIATLDDETMRDPERDVGYGITDTWDEMLVGMPGEPATDETELGRRVTDLVTTMRHDTNEIYGRLDDAQTERQMVTSHVNMLVVAQRSKIVELRAADRRRQTQLTEALKLMKTLQIHLTALQSRRGPARGPAQPDAPEEAGSSS
ncbi:hypothetical protein Tco_0127575 [Tanacetum coccineum]